MGRREKESWLQRRAERAARFQRLTRKSENRSPEMVDRRMRVFGIGGIACDSAAFLFVQEYNYDAEHCFEANFVSNNVHTLPNLHYHNTFYEHYLELKLSREKESI